MSEADEEELMQRSPHWRDRVADLRYERVRWSHEQEQLQKTQRQIAEQLKAISPDLPQCTTYVWGFKHFCSLIPHIPGPRYFRHPDFFDP